MNNRRRAIVVIAAGLAGVIAVGALTMATTVASDGFTVTASSTAPGTSPQSLLTGAEPGWRSSAETTGAWVQVTWSEPRTISGTAIESARGPNEFRSAAVTFDGEDSLLLTAGESGDAAVHFAKRVVVSIRVSFIDVIEGADSVNLSALHFTADDAGDSDTSERSVAVSVSSGDGYGALVDGEVGDDSAVWTPVAGDDQPWVELSWLKPRTIASTQIFGPIESAYDPAASASASLHGELVFDDGSRVTIAAIDGDAGEPTTIAFMPRIVTSVRFELATSIPQATVSIREVAVYDAGVTPPISPISNGYVVDPRSESCVSDDPVASTGGPVVICPAPGTIIYRDTAVIVEAPPGSIVELAAPSADGTGEPRILDTAPADGDGRARLLLEAGTTPWGPNFLRASIRNSAAPATYVEIFNPTGEHPSSDPAPEGMTLQWSEDFDQPLSISSSGAGSRYAAVKPEPWGGSEFGDASFVDPADHSEILATLQGTLRIRLEPRRSGQGQWGQKYLSGILSSARVGGAGFAAQYGYFEARLMGAPGKGTWPAFWLLDSESVTDRRVEQGEIDVVELYGHNTHGSCHAVHNWLKGTDSGDAIRCLEDNGKGDWATGWHTYGVRVLPDKLTYYVDGVEVAANGGVRRHVQPYFFMIDLALGGGWPVDLQATGDTADLYVDWVRVYT